jgi:hypothetical protein
MCLFCSMSSVGSLELMLYSTSSNICDLHFPVDFRLDDLFPHIFWFLHQNRVGIDGFTLTIDKNIGDEEKTIPSSLDTSTPMIAHQFCSRAHSALKKQTDWPKLRFKFFGFRNFKCSESECWITAGKPTNGVVQHHSR